MTKKKNTIDKGDVEIYKRHSFLREFHLQDLEHYIFNPEDGSYIIYNSKSEKTQFSREEQIQLAQERIKRLKDLTLKMKTPEGLKQLELESQMFREYLESEKDQLHSIPSKTDAKIAKLEDSIGQLISDLSEIKNECNMIKKSFIDYVSNSVFQDVARLQFLEVEVYLDTSEPDSILDAYSYLKLALDNLGYTYELELPAVFGSWYKRFLAKSKSALTSEEVTSRLKEVEYAFEVKVLKDQSEVDKNQSEAVLNILKGIESTPNAVIRIGSLLVIKVTNPSTNVPSIQVRTLAIKELHFLNKNPHLTNHPADLLSALAAIPTDSDNLLN